MCDGPICRRLSQWLAVILNGCKFVPFTYDLFRFDWIPEWPKHMYVIKNHVSMCSGSNYIDISILLINHANACRPSWISRCCHFGSFATFDMTYRDTIQVNPESFSFSWFFPVLYYEFDLVLLGPRLLKIFMLKSMLINKNFQTWLLIGWQHSRQPIRSHVRKFVLNNMDFNMDFIQYYSTGVQIVLCVSQWNLFDKKISQWDCVFQIRLGLEENDSPLHLVTSTGFLKA